MQKGLTTKRIIRIIWTSFNYSRCITFFFFLLLFVPLMIAWSKLGNELVPSPNSNLEKIRWLYNVVRCEINNRQLSCYWHHMFYWESQNQLNDMCCFHGTPNDVRCFPRCFPSRSKRWFCIYMLTPPRVFTWYLTYGHDSFDHSIFTRVIHGSKLARLQHSHFKIRKWPIIFMKAHY